jgi:hypothetical protein
MALLSGYEGPPLGEHKKEQSRKHEMFGKHEKEPSHLAFPALGDAPEIVKFEMGREVKKLKA